MPSTPIPLHHEIHAPQNPAPPIVLLHGLGSCAEDWPLQLPAFTRAHRVLTVDLRGHGRSDKPDGAYTISTLAADVAALLYRLGEAPAHLVGLSLGGATALQMGIEYPEQVRSLVLLNTFARLQPAGLGGLLRFVWRGILLRVAPMEQVGELVARGLFPKPEQALERETVARRIGGNNRAAYRRAVGAILRYDACRELGQITAPTLVIAGDRDATVPMSAKLELQRGIPGAKLAVIPDSGHASNIDQPERFNQLVLGFVGSVS